MDQKSEGQSTNCATCCTSDILLSSNENISSDDNGISNALSVKFWHTPDHRGIRNSIIKEIIKLLKTRRPNATEDWHEKLPHMAGRLEDALYHEAAGLDEYSDNGSLKQRLQKLTLPMGGNAPVGRERVGKQAIRPYTESESMMMDSNSTEEITKQQQQRLLLLRHASQCPHDKGSCKVTQYCWRMKQLWRHIMSCKDKECKIQHCVSSRYMLSHYSKCKEIDCRVCGPVREAIKYKMGRS